jgi:hypothetical protein
MDSIVVGLAKTLCTFEVKDLEQLFNQCEDEATVLLSKYLTTDKLSEYINSTLLAFSSAELGTKDYLTRLHLNYVNSLKNGDIIKIPNDELLTKVYAGSYVVENINYDDLTIEIRKTFTVTDSGSMTNFSSNNVLYAHAYFIVYLVAQHAQNIVKKDVIFSSQQFGQGTIAPASQSEKKLFFDKYKNLALSYLNNTFNFMVV